MIATRYVTISVATVDIPASTDGLDAVGRHLIGIGLFLAEREQDGRWRFARRSAAIAAGKPDDPLLVWAAARLPADATLIGWNVDHAIMPVLLDAASAASASTACHFLERLTPLLRGGVVDMALDHGGAGAAPIAPIAADFAIYAPSWDGNVVSNAWATGNVEPLRRDLADEALAIWRIFVRSAGSAGLDAESATDGWAAQSKALRVVDGAAGAD